MENVRLFDCCKDGLLFIITLKCCWFHNCNEGLDEWELIDKMFTLYALILSFTHDHTFWILILFFQCVTVRTEFKSTFLLNLIQFFTTLSVLSGALHTCISSIYWNISIDFLWLLKVNYCTKNVVSH
jgi:hypothetical protein